MKSKLVVALTVVCDDVQLAYDYFADRSTGGGDRVLKRYSAGTDSIALHPWSFPVIAR